MEHTDLIAGYRRFLKRRNYSTHTVKNYVNMLDHFMNWLKIPIEQVTSKKPRYMDHLLRRRKKPKTINCHFSCIHAFYDHLIEDEGMPMVNPIKKNYRLRLPATSQASPRRRDYNTLQKDQRCQRSGHLHGYAQMWVTG